MNILSTHLLSKTALPKTYHRLPLQEVAKFLYRRLRSFYRNSLRQTIYSLAALFYKQDKLILYSASPDDKFGNMSALASKLTEKRMPFIWLSRRQLQFNPLRTLITLAKAQVLVIDASSPAAQVRLSSKTCLIHCWHAGGAYKKVGFDAKRKGFDDLQEEKRIRKTHRNISYFVTTSTETAQIYARAFRLPQERMLNFGCPRLDALMQRELSPAPATYTVLYAPTYRTREKNIRCLPPLPDASALCTRLVSLLGEEVRFAFRGHPTTPTSTALKGWEDWSDLPLHDALQKASVLITDYSSIFFDYLPFNRPVVFYIPDFDDYQRRERELYFLPHKVFRATTCTTEKQLLLLLQQCRGMTVDHSAIWQKYMSDCDGNSSERLSIFIQNILKGRR